MISVFVRDIKHSIETKSYFAALSLALTLPDICGNAEFPDRPIAERYIEWYNKYIGNNPLPEAWKDDPWLSGEIIYNLRNTFLHQGSPTIIRGKVKEKANQLDRFVFILGDGTLTHSTSLNITAGTQETGKYTYKLIAVDITYLCGIICDAALQYYEKNRGRFKFNFEFIMQEELAADDPSSSFSPGELFAKLLNQKLEKEGSTKRFVRKETQEKTGSEKNTNDQKTQNKKQAPKNVSKHKLEAQLRAFFGSHFKKKIYTDKKEEIIRAVLKSRTKQQVNNALMKHFEGKKVSVIYKRLRPFIKDLPGK